MPNYSYVVKKNPQETLRGNLEAESKAAAVARLRAMGLFPLEVAEDTGEVARLPKSDGQRKRVVELRLPERIKSGDVAIFLRQLSNLMSAGLPVTRSLGTLISQTEKARMQKVIDEIRADVQKGSTLAESFSRHPQLFPSMYVNMIKAGETGGMLEDVLIRLANFAEAQEHLKGKVLAALAYPAFLLCAGAAAVFVLLSFVFPRFMGLFDVFGVALPWPTRVVMGVTAFMSKFWWVVLAGVVCIALGLRKLARTEAGRWAIDRRLLKTPLVGKLVLKIEVSKFARTLGTLLDNGVAILQALKMVSETLSNRVIAADVEEIRVRVEDGSSLNEAMEAGKSFPPMVVNMLAVGEESGTLGEVCKKVAETYDEEVDRTVKALTSLLEPVLILFMGVFVGFLVIAMLLPMFMISTLVK